MNMLQVSSPAFENGRPIPAIYSRGGLDLSPPLKWSPPPDGTQSVAIICEDVDTPKKPWVHWILYNLPASNMCLKEGISHSEEPNGFLQGVNDYGEPGYGGPNPPHGKQHRYMFRVLALDSKLNLPGGITRDELYHSIQGHLLAQGQLMGKFQR